MVIVANKERLTEKGKNWLWQNYNTGNRGQLYLFDRLFWRFEVRVLQKEHSLQKIAFIGTKGR